MKLSRLQNNLQFVHPEHKGKDKAFFRKRRDDRVNQREITSMLTRSKQKTEYLHYLYLIIAQQGNPHTIRKKS